MSGDAPAAVRLLLPYLDHSVLVAVTLAEAYAAMNETGTALEILIQAAERFNYDDLIIEAARIAAAAKHRERAEELLNAVLTSAADSWAGRSLALRFLGELQGDRGDWTAAMTSWTGALQRDPFDVTVRWYLAERQVVRGNDEQAWEVLTADPQQPGRHRDLPEPSHAGYAHLALVLLHRRGNRTELVSRALDYIETFFDHPQFPGIALALLYAPDVASDDFEGLDAVLQARLNQAVAEFHRTHPDDPAFRTVAIDPNADPEELVSTLAEYSRLDPRAVEDLKLLEGNVVRGVTPFGLVPERLGKSYAQLIVQAAAWLLAAEGDDAEHTDSTDTALRALGITLPAAPDRTLLSATPTPTTAVVIDTTALYTCSAVRDLQLDIRSGFRQVVIADTAFTDVLQAHEYIATDQLGIALTDPETGRFTIHATNPAVQQTHRAIIAEMRGLATGLRREVVRDTTGSMLDQLDSQHMNTVWCATLRLAHDKSAILWADDIALRNLAREMGIPAFSTLALIDARAQLNQLTPEQREEALRALAKAYIGDLSLSPAQLTGLLDEGREGRLAVLQGGAQSRFVQVIPWFRAPGLVLA